MKHLSVILLFFLFFYVSKASAIVVTVENKAEFNVSVAQELDELATGLMFVKELDDNRGMLFDFRAFQGRELSMWMKNTYIPLDMLFIDCNLRIVDIYKNAKPLSLKHIKSKAPYCYVLEINAGLAYDKNIMVGDKIWYEGMK